MVILVKPYLARGRNGLNKKCEGICSKQNTDSKTVTERASLGRRAQEESAGLNRDENKNEK